MLMLVYLIVCFSVQQFDYKLFPLIYGLITVCFSITICYITSIVLSIKNKLLFKVYLGFLCILVISSIFLMYSVEKNTVILIIALVLTILVRLYFNVLKTLIKQHYDEKEKNDMIYMYPVKSQFYNNRRFASLTLLSYLIISIITTGILMYFFDEHVVRVVNYCLAVLYVFIVFVVEYQKPLGINRKPMNLMLILLLILCFNLVMNNFYLTQFYFVWLTSVLIYLIAYASGVIFNYNKYLII